MSMAIKVERELRPRSTRKSNPTLATSQKSSPPIKTTIYPSNSRPRSSSSYLPNNRPTKIRRLTDRELQSKKAKGLCYRCDEKWNPGHRCKKKELSVLFIHEDEAREEESPPKLELEPTLETPENTILSGICLNSVLGTTNPKTLK
uniref:Uncharacterized protein n=1 Tax=Lactuca sativa TaxID=4236 RepID=A0A9R1V1E7_LACSA|nr:hypothetical protein LSAT_V11C700342890 [Lactuca sativa]